MRSLKKMGDGRLSSFKFFWSTHKWVGIIIAVVVLNFAVTGFLLLIKKQVAWIQPPENRGIAVNTFGVTFDDVLSACQSDPTLAVQTWEDVDRLDVRPGKGILKVRTANRWEAQIDLSTGEVLQVAYRRSDMIESIHDGSIVADWVRDWVLPAAAVSLMFLVFSGLWLWLEPAYRRAQRRRRSA
ncbi:MAG: PepSY domain-containing protein [Planctomycetes bacterium]|nr:PepSY domain-containing protein [Planctomycetota bacterium]